MSDASAPPSQSIQDAKVDLRRRLLKARQAIPRQQWLQKSDRICSHLYSWRYLQAARVILSYVSFRREPDLSRLHRLHARPWGLPRCISKTDMAWHYWTPNGRWPLHKGAYGISEPHPNSPIVDPALVDLILVPAVACDIRGHRLGYGGGYYDRMLNHPTWKDIPTVGIVFEYARLPSLPQAPWDRPLRGVCTESGLFLPDSKA